MSEAKGTMRFISPEKILAERFRSSARPSYSKAMICFLAIGPCERIVAALNARPTEGKVLWGMESSEDKPFTFEADLGAERILIAIRCNWGGPQAAILVEEMACLGIKTILGLGAAGGLEATFGLGDQIVAAECPALDGTSKVYSGDPSFPDPGLFRAAQAFGSKPAGIATHDAFYREDDSMVAAWKNAGLQAVNMESAAFYASATSCGVAALWLGSISDKIDGTSHTWAADRNLMTDETLRIAVKVLEQLIRTP
jgi:uridine phosphorylase